MKYGMKKTRSRSVKLAAVLLAGSAFSGTASAWKFEHGWSCQNKWYQMGHRAYRPRWRGLNRTRSAGDVPAAEVSPLARSRAGFFLPHRNQPYG